MANSEPVERQRHRSPSYPFISLEDAIEKARIIYDHDQRHTTSSEVVVKYWGYKPTTSNGKLCLAALKKFGFLDDVGGSKGGQVKLSRLALSILLLDENEHHEERLKAIQEAALLPKIHAELWDEWGSSLPSDATMRATLIRDWDFNDSYVGNFIKQYRRTISFAKLDEEFLLAEANEGDIIEDGETDTQEPERPPETNIRPKIQMHTSIPSPTAPQPASGLLPLGSPTGAVVDLNYPLLGSEFAVLRVTKPLSRESFELLKRYIELLGISLVPQAPPQEASPQLRLELKETK